RHGRRTALAVADRAARREVESVAAGAATPGWAVASQNAPATHAPLWLANATRHVRAERIHRPPRGRNPAAAGALAPVLLAVAPRRGPGCARGPDRCADRHEPDDARGPHDPRDGHGVDLRHGRRLLGRPSRSHGGGGGGPDGVD